MTILAIDQGTTGTTALLVDEDGRVAGRSYAEVTQIYPKPGWVEHSPKELFDSCITAIGDVLAATRTDPNEIAAIGIANQQETTVVWDRNTSEPAANAVVWQCRRTAGMCDEMKSRGLEPEVRRRTGLPVDAYFSATKLRWLLDHVPDGQARAENGELLFGTVDSWLIWNLTGGAAHVTDATNASRTMLLNLDELTWDRDMLRELNIPEAMLPKIANSSGVAAYATAGPFGGLELPIAGIAGDQKTALFGQACFKPGSAKNTYGTGCFMLMNTGVGRRDSSHGLVTTLAWALDGERNYALEGSVFSAGATVQWLRDGLGIIDKPSDMDWLAAEAPDNGGVYFVPAFSGLGAPHWDMYARGALIGLTGGTNRSHIARAALEATAYQCRDVLDAMAMDTGTGPAELRVDGGGTANELLMQLQADMLGIPLHRSAERETTGLGAAYLAGLGVGTWRGKDEIAELWRTDRTFEPSMPEGRRAALYDGWKEAVRRSLRWADGVRGA